MGLRGPVNEAQVADLDPLNRSQSHLLGIINDISSLKSWSPASLR